MAKDLNGYQLSRAWFDFCFDNPDKINPNHTAIFFFAIEHCNRLGWKTKFGFPTQMTMDAIGIKKHQTYIKYFNDLCEWKFFNLVQKSVNQYSANIISLGIGMLKNGKALDKAFITHAAKQTEPNGQSTGQSNSSIDKPLTINNKQGIRKENTINDELTELELAASKEFISITLHRDYKPERLIELWKAFVIQNLKKYYPNRQEKVNHFRNWIKTQPYEKEQNIKQFQSTGPTLKKI